MDWQVSEFSSGDEKSERACGNIDPENILLSNFADKTCIHQHPHMNDQPLKPTEVVSSFTLLYQHVSQRVISEQMKVMQLVRFEGLRYEGMK